MSLAQETVSGTGELAPAFPAVRWAQLGLSLIAMMSISSPQYVWTLFVAPFQAATGANLPAVQITFSLLIVLQTWLAPLQGWLVDRFGPKFLIAGGAALTGLGFVLSAQATTTWTLYLTYGGLCGFGTGIVYIGIIGLMVRWFPDRRGFAVGLAAAGYGFGAIVTTFPIDAMLKSSGHRPTLVTFGLLLGVIGVCAALGLRAPRTGEIRFTPASLPIATSAINYTPLQMLKTPIFWLMFAMMTMMSTGGLMVVSQFAPVMRDFGIAEVAISGMAALPLALTLQRVANGLTRPFFGWISDNIGREWTMFIAFGMEALAVWLMLSARGNPALFALLSGVVFFGWGEIFSLFPSTLTDTYGTKHATTNFGFLYIAQGVGSVLGGPAAAWMHDATGSWFPVFWLIIGLDAATALLALLVLKPMRAAWHARQPTVSSPVYGGGGA
ncbi:MAG TPA: oxalate/formate MFS antiporter [Micropepsaceae bacterium]|nr:oxalate/formate MFS antiporter [Micropepsaceae bacterium]